MRGLERLRQHLDALVAPDLSSIRERLVAPSGQYDLDAFAKAVGALRHGHVEGLELRAGNRPRPREELQDANFHGGPRHQSRCLAMISRMISEVPDAIVHSRTSRKKRSTGSSRM